ncbi:hypothetical protein HYY71_04165 [Candidatus Woesearchaeota archaeon]|nr:hypothetical protein [Candidatus Woesearchaeota archaeon]
MNNMAKEKYVQLIASFLIVLVLTLPFYTTSVYAAINRITARGGNGIEGFARANDFLNFNAQVSIGNDTITSNQVVLGSNVQFDRCASIGNGSECTLRLPRNGTQSFEPRQIPFAINLFRDDGRLDESRTSNVTIDNKAPQVRLSITQNLFSSQQNVVINFEVTDTACNDPSCAGRCVGIKNIEFRNLNRTFAQTITPATNDCVVRSNISISPRTLNDGANSIFAKASDRFDQVSQETSVTFAVDTSAPVILPNSFAITRKGISLNTFSQNSVPVDVVVNISANDLAANSVTADLSALNPSQSLRNARATCTSFAEGEHICRWNIELSPGTPGLKTLTINASDTSGNRAGIAISKSLALDQNGPVVQSLSSSSTNGTRILVRPNENTITSVFDEATGLSADEVFLHIDGSRTAAARCNRESNWICVWNNLNFGSSSRMSIQSDTTDVLLNPVSERSEVEVVVDRQAPVLRSMNISPVGGVVQAFPGFFKIGDKIGVVANLTEDNDVTAVADFSRFISGASRVAGSCERLQADEHMCAWLTDSINLQASDFITFNFTDSAGNSLIVTRSLRTFGLENATVPDFWTNTVDCSPSAIDRQLGPLINQRVFCQVSLRQRSTTRAVSTVFIAPATCTSPILESVETFNAEVGSTSPVLKLTLKKDDFKVNNASISCSLNIFSRIGSSTDITRNPEIENARIDLAFSNLPLGEVSDEVKRKIKDAKDDAEGIWDIIGTLNKIVFYAKKICGLLHTLYNIVAVLWTFVNFITATEIAEEKTPAWVLGLFTVKPTAISGCAKQTTTRVAVQETNKHLNWACSFVNCKQSILWGPTVQNWIDNAPLLVGPGQYLGSRTEVSGKGFFDQEIKNVGGGFGRPVSQYMDPQRNLFVAALFACLPGVIYGLDKYRQIKCLYADCVKNAVGKEGLPLTACENQKSYATCKYVTSELFALFPWTAVFDHFMGIIKNSLSNPFTALGPAISFACSGTCPNPNPETRLSTWGLCETARLFNQMGSIASDVKNIIDEGFKIRQDYCSRLDDED